MKDNKALSDKASCEMYVTEEVNLPPVLLVHGDQDIIVSVEQSRRLHEILKDNHKTVTYYELEGIGHGGSTFWAGDLIDYLEKFIQNP